MQHSHIINIFTLYNVYIAIIRNKLMKLFVFNIFLIYVLISAFLINMNVRAEVQADISEREINLELGIMAFDEGDYSTFNYYILEILNNNSNDKDAHLFLGLGLYKLNNLNEAYKEFVTAESLMDSSEAQVFKALDYLFDMSERELPANKKLLLERYSRVAYANLKFSIPGKNIHGWKTDRGRIYIDQGEPDKKKTVYSERSEIAPETDTPSQILWYYPDSSFIFTDFHNTREYKLNPDDDISLVEQYNKYKQLQSIPFSAIDKYIQTGESLIYDHDYIGRIYRLNSFTASFRGRGGKSNLEIYYEIPLRHLHFEPKDNKYYAEIKQI